MKNRKDSLNGDYSFKSWFKIMWTNGYIFLFLVGLGGIIAEFILLDSVIEMIKENFDYSNWGGIMSIIGIIMPWAICGIISYKAFYQFWEDLKNGRSR